MEAYKADPNKKKSWSEVNKTRKEEKRKWREINLEKKMKKQQLKGETKQETDAAASLVPKTVSTLSIAVPGSILENTQTPELRCYLAGQIARAACIFQVYCVCFSIICLENPLPSSLKITVTRTDCFNRFGDITFLQHKLQIDNFYL